jgi:hypothetical protein
VSKENPTFTKINIFGYQVDDVNVFAKKGDVCTQLTVADQKTEEYAIYLTLQEQVNCDVLRFEFGKELVELYEIELA